MANHAAGVGIDDILTQSAIVDAAPQPAPGTSVAMLELALAKFLHHDPGACELFASVARKYDFREAWLGLSVARYLNNEIQSANIAMAHALSHHACSKVPALAISIAESSRTPGWCSLDSAGTVTVRLVKELHDNTHLNASLDGTPVIMHAKSGGRDFIGQLPEGWRRAGEIRVCVNEASLLGSPILVTRIARVEGFTASLNGDLHGWAWCPNDIDHDPVLSVVPLNGDPEISVVAADGTIRIVVTSELARPRGFQISASQLQHLSGPVSVRGVGGGELMGSPLDPSTERRAAVRTAQILARHFPAPGRESRSTPRDPPLLTAPAHVVGPPAEGGRKKRAVDVIVPVYGRLDLALPCLASVLADIPRWARVVVVDDASPDSLVAKELGKLAARRRITLLTQAVNRGFPSSANVGMRNDIERDVVLLNSDTLVPPGWLSSLRDAAYSAPDVGTATPLSNDATILSYPIAEQANPMPDLDETINLFTLAKRANDGRLVDIPTAVGFCMYIKRDCLNATGLFREDVFAQGYGEENDFCIRARHLGWRHVAAPGVFVSHAGGHSFGSAKYHLSERNLRTLNQLHPGYDALVRKFAVADPLAESRRRLDMERWKTFRTNIKSVLLITHARAGGVRRHVTERAAALRAEGYRPIVLWPMESRQDGSRDCVLGDGPEGGTPNLRFTIPGELDLLTRVLKKTSPVHAEIHHMIGHDHRLMELFPRLGIPYQIVVHDYSWFCPRVNLVGADKHYCGEPDVAGCEACVADAGSTNDEATPPDLLWERSAIEMRGASSVVVPSNDAGIRIRRHFPFSRPKTVNWEDDSLLPPLNPPPIAADRIRRVCVVGAIGVEKGYEMLLACARDAARRKLNLRFHLVGYSCDDHRLIATGNVHITGQYEEHQAVKLIQEQRAQLAWLPSLWPETWSYTLTQAWQAALNVLAFDIGAQSERIKRTGRGWLVPIGLTPQSLNDKMLELHPAETNHKVTHFVTPEKHISRSWPAPSLVLG